MPTYRVYLQNIVSTSIEVEADTPEDATERVYDSSDMPGSLAYGAFGSANVNDSEGWDIIGVTDADGKIVWPGVEDEELTCEIL